MTDSVLRIVGKLTFRLLENLVLPLLVWQAGRKRQKTSLLCTLIGDENLVLLLLQDATDNENRPAVLHKHQPTRSSTHALPLSARENPQSFQPERRTAQNQATGDDLPPRRVIREVDEPPKHLQLLTTQRLDPWTANTRHVGIMGIGDNKDHMEIPGNISKVLAHLHFRQPPTVLIMALRKRTLLTIITDLVGVEVGAITGMDRSI